MRFSHLADGLTFTLIVTLALIICINKATSDAFSATEICINGKCKMTSEYEGYHSQKTCINDDCEVDKRGTASSDNQLIRQIRFYIIEQNRLLSSRSGYYRN